MRSIDEAVRLYDKLIVICSRESLQSPAVIREIERALQKEDEMARQGKEPEVLFPLRLDDYMTRGAAITEKTGPGIYPVLQDGVTVVSSKGEVLRSFFFNSLFPEAAPEPTAEAIKAYVKTNRVALKGPETDHYLDTLHSNSVTVLPRDVPGLGRFGDILLSMRRTDTIAVLDATGQNVKWRWGPGELMAQHHPNLLDNDCLLIFDNGRHGREGRPWSRIVEYCPRENQIVWEYQNTQEDPFFSRTRGSVQRLDNDNVLVTESDNGRVFEVTRGGEVVREWFNPKMSEFEDKVRREAIYRMTRISGGLLDSLPLRDQTSR